MSSSVGEAFSALARTMDRLIADEGCAWHNVQTHQTLIRYLIEESYELVEAIETNAPPNEVKEELADLLYQVLFHAAIAQKMGEGFDLVAVADTLNEKLIARHPHVFSDRGHMTVDELNAEWEQLKANASGQQRAVLEGIASTMPTLARAEKIVDRLERAGLADPLLGEWLTTTEMPDFSGKAAEVSGNASTDIGRKFLSLLRESHARGVNADEALRNVLREVTDTVADHERE